MKTTAMKLTCTAVALASLLLAGCGGGSSSGSAPDTQLPQEDTPDTPILSELIDLSSVKIRRSNDQTLLSLTAKAATQLNYGIFNHPLERSSSLVLPKQQALVAGNNSLVLTESDQSGRRLYFHIVDNGIHSDKVSLLIPVSQSLATSTINNWLCPDSEQLKNYSNTSLQVPAYLIDIQPDTEGQIQFTLASNPEWQCDLLTAQHRSSSHEYLQNLTVDIWLQYPDQQTLQSQRFSLTFSAPNHAVTFPASTSAFEINYSTRSRYRGIYSPTLVSPTEIIDLVSLEGK